MLECRTYSNRLPGIVTAFAFAIVNITPFPAQSSPRNSCAATFDEQIFDLLKPGQLSTNGPRYFEGTDKERTEHAASMTSAGRGGVENLLAHYKTSIPKSLPVLEIGPFVNPLGSQLADQHPWIVWEYDQSAAQKIADSSTAHVFRIDLNSLDSTSWAVFLQKNAAEMGQTTSERMRFGAALLSSVLNYIDYDIVIKKIIDHLADDGIIFIGNSNVGDSDMMRGRHPPNGSQILEHLMIHYGDKLEILPETKLTLDSFNGSRTGIELAARVRNKSDRSTHKIDLYQQGMEIYTKFRAMPFLLSYPTNPDSENHRQIREIWESKDPEVVATEFAAIRAGKHKYQNNLPRNLQSEIQFDVGRRNTLIERVLSTPKKSEQIENLRKEIAEPTREFFLPERETLLQALRLPVERRSLFLKRELARLYQKLGHQI